MILVCKILNGYSNLIWINPFNEFSKGNFMNTEASLKENILHDITHWGISASIGAIFIVHSLKKFDPSWQEWLASIGLPPEMQLPIALAEFIGGILLDISHQMGKWIFCFSRRMGMGFGNASCSTVNNCCRPWENINITRSKENP
jgi:hypothetical protein